MTESLECGGKVAVGTWLLPSRAFSPVSAEPAEPRGIPGSRASSPAHSTASPRAQWTSQVSPCARALALPPPLLREGGSATTVSLAFAAAWMFLPSGLDVPSQGLPTPSVSPGLYFLIPAIRCSRDRTSIIWGLGGVLSKASQPPNLGIGWTRTSQLFGSI